VTKPTSELLQSASVPVEYETEWDMPIKFCYYSLYLLKFLQDTDNDLMNDKEFISSRADLAAEEFENVRRDGASVAVAQESAMAVSSRGSGQLGGTASAVRTKAVLSG